MAMDVREKIVELLTEFYGVDPMYLGAGTNALIEYLIAKGVTVQEWISVDDSLPDSCGFPCILCGENSFGQIRVFEGFTGYMERGKFEWHSNQKDVDIDLWKITHWMPLPQPPKGE